MSCRNKLFTRWLIVSTLLFVTGPLALADPQAPGASDRAIAGKVASLVNRDHFIRHPLDKEISARCLKMFLKSLDPWKLYFYQSDIDEYQKHQDQLCDEIARGDLEFAYTVYRTFLQRVDERLATIDQLLAKPMDFTVDEEMIADRDETHYPRTPAEAADRWRRRLKYDMLILKSADKEEDKKEGREAVEKLTRRYHSLAKRLHQTDNEELLETYLNAFTMSFDPHTDYMSPDTQKNFAIAMSLELEGIGASLQSEDGYTTVRRLIPGGAAEKDGRLKLGDKISGVGQGADGEIADIVDLKINDVVRQIRGKRGTIVRLEVIPADGSGKKIYDIVREKIELKDSEAQGKVFDVSRKGDGTPYRIGVIRLPSFYRDMEGDRRGDANFRSTTRDVRKILDDFHRKNVDAVVLDLRLNGGGSLNEAISLTGLFIPKGPVVQVKNSRGRVDHLDDDDGQVAWAGPLVVVINKFSASASEILAGAIQDYGRGLIVGDYSTHGKGTVQTLMDVGREYFGLPNSQPMGALKITVQQFYRPDGDSTQQRGVLADIELPSITTHLNDVSESDLDYAVAFDRVPPTYFQKSGNVNPAVRDHLRRLSEQRIANSKDFQKVIRNIFRYKQQKAKKTVTLNEDKFLAERSELNADKETEKVVEKQLGQNDDGIERDYYLDEVLAITADLMELQHIAKAAPKRLGIDN